jgi:TonB family protein
MKLTLLLIPALALWPPAAPQDKTQGCEQHADRVYTQNTVDEKAKITRRHLPLFPEAARRKNVRRGEVMMRVVLRPDGTVTDIKVLKTTDEVFNKISVEAAKKTRFEPALKGGCPVAQSALLMNSYTTR